MRYLENIPTEILNQAILEAPEGRPVQFFCRQDTNAIQMASTEEIRAELAVRKLEEEVHKNVRFYDKSYIENLRLGTHFTTVTANATRRSEPWPQNIPSSVGTQMVPYKDKVTVLDKIFKLLDKFSIGFSTGAKHDAQQEATGNVEREVHEVVLDTRAGPSGTSEASPAVETKGE